MVRMGGQRGGRVYYCFTSRVVLNEDLGTDDFMGCIVGALRPISTLTQTPNSTRSIKTKTK